MHVLCLMSGFGRRETYLPRAQVLRKGGGGKGRTFSACSTCYLGRGKGGGGEHTHVIKKLFSSQKLHLISSLYLYTSKTIKYSGLLQREKKKSQKEVSTARGRLR